MQARECVALFSGEPADDRREAVIDALVAALRLPLLFHGGGDWTEERRAEWKALTGSDEATTKVMCDTIRAALARVAPPVDVPLGAATADEPATWTAAEGRDVEAP
jgi:hypothetical protein